PCQSVRLGNRSSSLDLLVHLYEPPCLDVRKSETPTEISTPSAPRRHTLTDFSIPPPKIGRSRPTASNAGARPDHVPSLAASQFAPSGRVSTPKSPTVCIACSRGDRAVPRSASHSPRTGVAISRGAGSLGTPVAISPVALETEFVRRAARASPRPQTTDK